MSFLYVHLLLFAFLHFISLAYHLFEESEKNQNKNSTGQIKRWQRKKVSMTKMVEAFNKRFVPDDTVLCTDIQY